MTDTNSDELAVTFIGELPANSPASAAAHLDMSANLSHLL